MADHDGMIAAVDNIFVILQAMLMAIELQE
jgi:hypothetical protein